MLAALPVEIIEAKPAIRRQQLRDLVPLADTTIYEMEQRGEFPRRFALSARCVVWDLAEVEAWLELVQPGCSIWVKRSPAETDGTNRPRR